MNSAFSITVGPFTFEALTDSMKGAWDVIHTSPDGCPYTIGRLTLAAKVINMQPSRIPGPQPSQAQMNEFCNQWAAEAKRRREAAAQAAPYTFAPYDVLQVLRGGEWLDFATIRTAADAESAIRYVTNDGRDFGQNAPFRITDGRDTIKLEKPPTAAEEAATR